MHLRPALMPPPLDSAKVAQLTALANEILDCIDLHECNPANLLAEFNRRTGQQYALFDFHSVEGLIGLEAFVQIALTPPPSRIADITREELVELVRRLEKATGTEREQMYWLEVLERNVPHPAIGDLIYWPPRPMTAEEIVDEALAYKPIIL